MSGSLTRGGGENFPDIPGACTTRNFMYLARGPWRRQLLSLKNAPCNAYGHDMETFLHYSTFVRRIHRDRRVPFTDGQQATGLDAWASRVKCPARFVSHLYEICIYIWVVYSLCFFWCLFITVTWWYVWCFERASGNQEEVQACLVTLWLFVISCYSLYKTTLGLLCSWFENNPHFHQYSMDFHV